MKDEFIKIDEAANDRAIAELRKKYPNYPREGEEDLPVMGPTTERLATPEEIERFNRR